MSIVASWIKSSCRPLALACLLLAAVKPASADGVSAYLPLNLEPEIERQVERVLILADEPVLKRPIAVELVKLALPQACKVDKPLCTKVQRYLERYSRDYGVTHASATVTREHGADVVVPNEYGLPSTSDWEVSTRAYVQPSDYLLASGGVVAYSGRTNATGSALSLGFSGAQLDAGYLPHWLSPLTDSSALISTEAPTMPSVTLSNWEPLTRLGFLYQFSLAREIADRQQQRRQPARRQHSVQRRREQGQSEAVPHAIVDRALSRLVVRRQPPAAIRRRQRPARIGELSAARFLEAERRSRRTREISKRPTSAASSIPARPRSRCISSMPARILRRRQLPARRYVRHPSGIDFPRIWHHFDLTYEVSEWQNQWYVHYIFLDGTTNDGIVQGNWGAQERNFGDGLGARSQMLRIGWEPPFGGYLQERVRTVVNQNYYGGDERVFNPGAPPAFPYHHYYDFTLTYSRPWNGVTVGGEVLAGRDVYGESFSRLSGFVRYGGDEHTRDDGTVEDESYSGGPNEHGAEVFVDAGANVNEVRYSPGPPIPNTKTSLQPDPHFAAGCAPRRDRQGRPRRARWNSTRSTAAH